MAEILFVTWDGGGNVAPAVGIARELQARGHGVRVLGHSTQRESITGAGLEFTAFPTARPFSSAGVVPVRRAMALFVEGAIGTDTLAEARRRPTDVVVVDCFLLGASRACSDAGLRYVTLEHLYDAYLRGPWLRSPIGLTAWAKGLRPVETWDGAARALVTTIPELDPAAGRPGPANRVHSGPVLDLPEPADLANRDPAVLVSLSTYGYAGMGRSLQAALDATACLDCRVIVTTGPVIDPTDLRAAPNHEVHRYVPHDELMRQVTLVVGHGGHATTMRALAHELPLVVMPMSALVDQPMVGRSVEAAGAGRVVSRRTRPDDLTPVIAGLLEDGPHRAAAARLGARIREARGTATAADLVLAAVGDPAAPVE